MEYSVKQQGGKVLVACGGEQVLLAARQARRQALYLALGADQAADRGTLVQPVRYGMPGQDGLEPFDAYDLADNVFRAAVLLEMDRICEEVERDLALAGPDLTVDVGGDKTARIDH